MKYIKFHKNFTLNGKKFENAQEILTFSKTISKDVFSLLTAWLDNRDFIEVKTSGSTGKPAIIQLKKEHMVNSALNTGNYFELLQNTKALLCLSPNYIAGRMMLVRALVLGWQLDVVAPESNPLKATNDEYDFCAMVPLQLSNSLSKLHHIKKLIVGGAAVSNGLINKLQQLPTMVYATYGMTETCTHIAVKRLNGSKFEVSGSNKSKNVPSSGVEMSLQGSKTRESHEENYKILPNIKITKDNRDCLVIDAQTITDHQIITNDLVELISETEFKWLGRYDTIINSGGVKLIPEQIEEKLSLIIKDRFFVAGMPDEVLGEKLVLIIEGDVTSSAVEKSQILNLKSLSKYETPKEIFFVDQFVETETKKIQRQLTLDLLNLK